MSKLLIYGIIALSVCGAVTAVIAGIYHKGYAAGEASIKAKWEEANRMQRDKESTQANAAAKGLGGRA